tara:strand:+ start:535 stop:669 length:135 start_codon:yes stop_codon:yes gene_type:complete
MGELMHSEDWYVEQYNRNRVPEDWVDNYIELINVMKALKKEYGE